MATFRWHGGCQSTFAPVNPEVFSHLSIEEMTSQLSFKAQQNVRSKFLIVVPGITNSYAFDPTDIPDAGVQTFSNLAAISSFFSGVTNVDLSGGDLYRDLGKAVYIKLKDGSNVAILRLVQKVSGAVSGGVPYTFGNSTAYVLTWISDPTIDTTNIGVVSVARTG